MNDDFEIEYRIQRRKRALRHLGRTIDELDSAGCDTLQRRLAALREELADLTPGKATTRKWRPNSARSGSANDNAAAEALEARLRSRFGGQ